MLKKIILGIIVFTVAAFALVLLVGYLYQNNNTKFSSQEISQNGPKDIPLMSVNMTSTEDCFKDKDCYFYMFSILASEDGDTIIYDKEGASPDPDNKGFWTSVSFKSVDGEINDKKRVYAVNAKTPTECIYDKECVWYAFYNLINRSAMGEESKNILSKWQTDIGYAISPTDTPKYNKYKSEIEKVFEKLDPYFPYDISFNKQFNYLLFFSQNFGEDIHQNYRDFFLRLTENNLMVREGLLSFFPKEENATCGNFPVTEKNVILWSINFVNPQKSRTDCLHHSLIYTLGFSGRLRQFPFSSLNSVNSDVEVSITNLDLFLVALLYQEDFQPGISTKPDVLRPVFDRGYSKTIEKFNRSNMWGE
ncbi:MAG: hypothetical protein CL565_00730 [Alphaproteobacteria bacterium]|nr:hypothetical protein [Alphaproteobacteria bacterium]